LLSGRSVLSDHSLPCNQRPLRHQRLPKPRPCSDDRARSCSAARWPASGAPALLPCSCPRLGHGHGLSGLDCSRAGVLRGGLLPYVRSTISGFRLAACGLCNVARMKPRQRRPSGLTMLLRLKYVTQ
jgi:hypothetical protein